MLASLLCLTCLLGATVSISATVDGRPAPKGWVYARVGQEVLLRAQPPLGVTAKDVRWFKLEPAVGSLDNTQPRFHFAPVPYRALEVSGCRGKLDCRADAAPAELPKVPEVGGAGTMAFQVRVTPASGPELASPGVESVRRGGLDRAVMRVTFRKDDSYLGYLTELVNTPYIFGSAGPDGENQTDELVGSDCADFAVYGRRRMGQRTAFTSSFAFDRTAPLRSTAARLDAEGVARAADGGTLGPDAARPGDVLHFPGSRHVAVLWEDRPPLGVLDQGDLMFHTCWAPPKVEPIGASDCTSLPWRVLRYPEVGRKAP